MNTKLPQTTAVGNWYGSNRMLAERVGRELAGCKFVAVPFAGGMSEVAHITARTLQVNDLHRHVINLARVIANDAARLQLAARVSDLPFHPDVLAHAQVRCSAHDRYDSLFSKQDHSAPFLDVEWAVDYFLVSWMSRGGTGGTPQEFTGGISTRWDAAGGGSNRRYRSAIESLEAWSALLRRCDFTTLDASAFLGKCKDEATTGIYCDPPFPGPGDKYTHPGTEKLQIVWRSDLARFKNARVVIRYYDHPFVRELYPEGQGWWWLRTEGRDRNNNEKKPEVLILNGLSRDVAGEVAA